MPAHRDEVLTPEDRILEMEWQLYMQKHAMAGCLAKTPALRNLSKGSRRS